MGQSKLEHVENVDEGKPVCFRLNSTQDSIIVQVLFDGLPQRNTSTSMTNMVIFFEVLVPRYSVPGAHSPHMFFAPMLFRSPVRRGHGIFFCGTSR